MPFSEYKKELCDEINHVLSKTDPEEFNNLVISCQKAKRIMIIGKGRVGLALKAFSMRLNAIGLKSCFLDEITSFHMTPNDLLIIGNMSGDAAWANLYIDAAIRNNVAIFYITSLDGCASNRTNNVLHIKARAYGASEEKNYPSCQPMSSTAEQCAWFILDAVSLALADSEMGTDISAILRHISNDIRNNLSLIDEEEVDSVISTLEDSDAKCFCAMGRLGAILNSFGMRIFHMGYDVYAVGETSWRPPRKGDALIACVSSEDASAVQPYIIAATKSGASVLVISNFEARDLCFNVSLNVPDGCSECLLPIGYQRDTFLEDAFEHVLFVVLDYIVYKMMRLHNWAEKDLSCNHANIQ